MPKRTLRRSDAWRDRHRARRRCRRDGVRRSVSSYVRAYREQALSATGIRPRFPLWNLPTGLLAREMLASGIRAVITCVDPAQAPAEIVGRAWDERLLAELPEEVDPCGEGGEFHTFVWNGPGFHSPIDIETGEIVQRDGFVFCDVHPAS